jgi:hypothetical protein
MELIAEVNVSLIAKGCFSRTVTVKNLDTQATSMPPEALEERQNSKLSNLLGGKVFQKTNINMVSFGFLKTENILPTLFNFVSQQAPFIFVI